jgi:hypothetical protein
LALASAKKMCIPLGNESRVEGGPRRELGAGSSNRGVAGETSFSGLARDSGAGCLGDENCAGRALEALARTNRSRQLRSQK